MNRTLCSLILLAIIASNALVGVHAASHISVDASECELCAAYNDPSDAIPADRVEIPLTARQAHHPEGRHVVDALSTPSNVQQRAPPASD